APILRPLGPRRHADDEASQRSGGALKLGPRQHEGDGSSPLGGGAAPALAPEPAAERGRRARAAPEARRVWRAAPRGRCFESRGVSTRPTSRPGADPVQCSAALPSRQWPAGAGAARAPLRQIGSTTVGIAGAVYPLRGV